MAIKQFVFHVEIIEKRYHHANQRIVRQPRNNLGKRVDNHPSETMQKLTSDLIRLKNLLKQVVTTDTGLLA